MTARTSIVVPFLNVAPYLHQAIASVQAQTSGDWELLLVDDGSSDGSGEIAHAAASADPRIRLIARPSGCPAGAARARNLALAEAEGEFVCFLDADDLFLPVKLARQIELLERYPTAAMVFGPTYWWHPGDPGRDWVEPVRKRGLIKSPRFLDETILKLRGDVPCICAVMIRRAAIAQVGGFEEQFRLYEDQTLWVKIMSAYAVVADDVVTAWYRQHPASVSAEAEEDGTYDRLRPHSSREPFIEWTRSYLQQRDLLAPSTRQALRCAFARVGRERDQLTFGDCLVLGGLAAERRFEWTVKRLRQRAQASR